MPWTFFNVHAEFFLSLGLLVCGLFSLGFALLIPKLSKADLQMIGRWCRNNPFSIPFAAAAMFWVTPHAAVLLAFLSPEALWLTMGIAFIACCIWLDFLCARAIAGLLILWIYTLINLTFTFHTPAATGFVVLNLILSLGVLGIAAKPYWLRDFLFWLGHGASQTAKALVIVFFGVYGLYSAVLGTLHFLGNF